jgi:uncharacterized protein (DUF169 family)
MNRIGIAILNKKPEHVSVIESRATHCAMIARARNGNVFYAEDVNYSCGLAIYNLGLGRDVPAFRRALAEDLVSIKNAAGEEVSSKLLESMPRLAENKKFIVFFPLDKMPLTPDIVILIGTPVEVMDVVWKITSQSGERIQSSIAGIGATCSELTAHTILTQKPSLSIGCCGSRRFGRLAENEIMLSLPWKVYRRVFESTEQTGPIG